jgi:hypothetical protein
MSLKLSLDGRFDLEGKNFQIPLTLREKLQTSLNTQFFTEQSVMQAVAASGIDGAVRMTFEGKGIELSGSGKRVMLARMVPVDKRVKKIIQYARQTGIVAREPRLTVAPSRESVKELSKRSGPVPLRYLCTAADFALDAISLGRNTYTSIKGGETPMISRQLGLTTAGLGVLLAAKDWRDGVNEKGQADKIGDGEGSRRAEAKILSMKTAVAGSVLYLADKTFQIGTSGVAHVGAAVCEHLSAFTFGIGSVIGIGMGILGIQRCANFQESLAEYLENRNLSEEARIEGAVRFLRDAAVVTFEERNELVEQIERDRPTATKAEKESLLQEKLESLSEVKVKWVKRRTSMRAVRNILHHADSILAKLESPLSDVRKQGAVEANLMFERVRGDSRKKQLLYAIGLFASLIGLAGLIIGTFFTFGALPFILYGISAGIYVLLFVAGQVSSLARRDADTPGLSMPPLPLTGHI